MPSRKRQKAERPEIASAQASEKFDKTNHMPTSSTQIVADPKPPKEWPPSVRYLNRPTISPYLTEAQTRWLYQRPDTEINQNPSAAGQDPIPVVKLAQTGETIGDKVEVKFIYDAKHPAYGQRGLFATRDLAPGELIIPYIGYIHSSISSESAVEKERPTPRASANNDLTSTANERRLVEEESYVSSQVQQIGSWDTSSYDLNLHRDEDIELAIDAGDMGNEARFCNDYRGVPSNKPNDTQGSSWNKKAKRSAKGWEETGSSASEGKDWSSLFAETAIPNAEFRDVWLEWPMEECPAQNPPYVFDSLGVINANEQIGTRINALSLEPDAGTIRLQPNTAASPSSNPVGRDAKRMRRQNRRRKLGIRGVAIFVLPAGKSGKRKHGVRAGQEVLVSYGKGFWAHHGLEHASSSGSNIPSGPRS